MFKWSYKWAQTGNIVTINLTVKLTEIKIISSISY